MSATDPGHLDAAALRAAGRKPEVPFSVALDDGSELVVLRLLRVLPGRRIVGEACHRDLRVLAKLFIAPDSERHFARERDGIAALAAAGIPTPGVVAQGAVQGGGQMLLTRFIVGASDLAQRWDATPRPAGDVAAITLVAPALAMLGRMHHAGLVQTDLHLGNFLVDGDELLVIDGDAVRRPSGAGPLTPKDAASNLAILLAQFPAEWDECLTALVEPYVSGGGPRPDEPALRSSVGEIRQRRLDDLLAKSVRDCTLFAFERNRTRFVSVVRDQADRLAGILANPDAAIECGKPLKRGRTASVAQVRLGSDQLVIKRYNIKSLGHALSRLCRPSRAWHAWHAAHRLGFVGIATPRPLALIEERFGPLRRRAWLITEHCPGPNLATVLDADREPPVEVADALIVLCRKLARERISHGDFKATNLLWHQGQIHLIDLDAMTAHRSAASWAHAWQRDRSRLQRNWPEQSALSQWLDRNLP